jgi:pyruvate formate lyase activating enzyme
MNFYGLQKHTLIDYPGSIACILFTYGCNFRCPYCHNPELLSGKDNLKPVTMEEVISFLKTRINLLQGVCITGGETLMNERIIEAVDEIKKLGFKVKIDTNGSYPEMLKKINADYIAMDIKTSFEKYDLITENHNSELIGKLKESIHYIINSGIMHEFRTTLVPYIVDKVDIKLIAENIKGAQKIVLAQFRPVNTLLPEWSEIDPYSLMEIKEMQQIVLDEGILCEIRGIKGK